MTVRDGWGESGTGWDGSYYRFHAGDLELLFLPEPGEALAEVSHVDAEIRLSDGSRWSATVVTVAEVERLMTRWAGTGEAAGGLYFWCANGLIVREPGLDAMADVLVGLVESGEYRQILQRLDTPA